MRVRTGLERLIDEGPASAGLADGARVALLAHPASVDRHGRHATELLSTSSGLRLVRLFAPEHGLWGEEQDMEAVGHARNPTDGLEVVSLYGENAESLRPSPESLDGLDAVLCDLQDVGSRYYTFVYTIAYMMEAARARGLPVVVLDRPNPLGGLRLEGPVLQTGLRSFVGRFTLPVRHGMTTAELALLFNDRDALGAELRVVGLDGWRREMTFEETGLPWVPPSPNMPTTATARVYPGGCLVEGTELSEGRGTTTPFELVGSPPIEPASFVKRLRRAGLAGVGFRPARFRPAFQKHAGQSCGGAQVIITDETSFRPFRTYCEILRAARASAPEAFSWRTAPYEFETERRAIDLLFGVPGLAERVVGNDDLEGLAAEWDAECAGFDRERTPYLLYADGGEKKSVRT